MSLGCTTAPCPVILDSTCVFYSGGNLVYTGINTNDNLQTALIKINNKFKDTGLGYVFQNGIVQSAPGQPVKLGGSLIENTLITSDGFTFGLTGTIGASAFITTGGTSSEFVKGDGSLDSTSYQPTGNYITSLTGDGVASGPGSSVFTLATVFGAPATYGSASTVPVVTVNAKGLVTNITTIPINYPTQPISFSGDVYGAGYTGSSIALTISNVNPNVYATNTVLKFAVNNKGLITSAAPITNLDLDGIYGYTPIGDAPFDGFIYGRRNHAWVVVASGGGTVTAVTATLPITASAGSTPNISTSMATNKLIGRGSAGTGVFEEITLGTGLSLTGTTLNASAVITPAALTKTDDTNVTLTLGGSPNTALLQATSLTLGWTGTLADSRIASAATWNAKFTLPALTAGSVLFSNGTTIAQDNANFFWDDTNNRLGVGTTTPTEKLEVVGNAKIDGTLTVVDSATNFNIVGNAFGQAYLQCTTGALVLNPGYGGVNINGVFPDLTVNGNITGGGLTGVGTRMVTANSSGTLSTQAIPSFTSPLTTKGDIYVRNGSADTRLPVGLDTQILLADSSTTTGLKWGTNTAATPLGYYGAFSDVTNQTAAIANTGYPMLLGITDLTNGVTVVSGSRVTIANTGIYNIQWSAQFSNPTAADHDVVIWLRKNGTDVPGTSGIVLVPSKHGAIEGHVLPSWNFLLDVVGGDYYEFVWSTDNANVYIAYNPAGNPPPSTASVVLTVTQQSGIMAGTGITAINSLTGAVQTLTTGTSGIAPLFTSTGTTHTLDIPLASGTGVTAGLISNTDYNNFGTRAAGGSFVAYYFNGSIPASVATYYQMSPTANIAAAANFTIAGNGLISQWLTDSGNPNRIEIPAGNWNFEMYMSASSAGGTPAFYVELLKYNGGFTSIASSVVTPKNITGGTSIDLYLTSLAIPQTTLLVTDRLAIRVYIVNNVPGRSITFYTQDTHISEVITNFAGGISALNGLTVNTQYFAVGTTGTDFGISSTTATHTFNLPTASATNRGALSSADWTTFNGKVGNSDTDYEYLMMSSFRNTYNY